MLLDDVRNEIRVRHYLIRTEKSYLNWIKRYIFFHQKKHPVKVGTKGISLFINHLANQDRVASSTQNQALCALVFLYREVLKINTEKLDDKVDAYIYIGDGVFHPRILAFNNKKTVFIYDPVEKKEKILDRDEIEKILKKQKGAYLKFLNSKEIGVVVSTKPGQSQFTQAQLLKKQYPDKNFYYFVFDTVNYRDLENFPFVECFVNTACPRMGLDDSKQFPKSVINLNKILKSVTTLE